MFLVFCVVVLYVDSIKLLKPCERVLLGLCWQRNLEILGMLSILAMMMPGRYSTPFSLALGEDSILGAPCQSKHGICAKEQPQGQHETTELIAGVNPFIKLPGMIIPDDQYFSMGFNLDHTTRNNLHHIATKTDLSPTLITKKGYMYSELSGCIRYIGK